MHKYGLDTCAMLVEFSAPVWTARKLDRKVSDEVVSDKGAGAKDAARVNKHLLAGRSELDVINQHVARVRKYVYTNTLPWSDIGLRLLPAAQFAKFDAHMRAEEEVYWDLAKKFVDVYPSLITAQAMALGDMFKRDEYPPPETIVHKFGYQVNYMPVPSAGDFRVDVGTAAQQELQKQLAKLAEERIDAAMQDVRLRLGEHLTRMSERLAVDVKDGKAKPRAFHDTMVEDGLALCDMVKALNVTGDKDLEHARASLERVLTSIEPVVKKKSNRELSIADTLREDMQQRSSVKAQVDSILDKFSF